MSGKQFNETIFENSPYGLAVCALDGSVIDVNPVFANIIGRQLNEIRQLKFQHFSSTLNGEHFPRHIESLLTNGKLEPFDDQFRHENGAYVNVCVSATILEDSGKKMICWFVEEVYQDTARLSVISKQSEPDYDLLLSAAQAKSILKSAADAIITITKYGVIHSFNPAAIHMFGYSVNEVLGKDISMLMPEPFRSKHANYIADYLATGEAKIIGIGREAIGMRKDQTTFAAHLSVSETRVGGETLFTGIIRDISQLKQAQQQLSVSEERFRRSQRSANIGTWDWNIKTGELYWSEQIPALFGYQEADFQTTYENFLNAVHPDDRQFVIDSVNDCIYQGAKYDIEHRCVWPDGTIKWMSERGDVTRDDAGLPSHMLGVVQDITLRKNAEFALLESEERFRGAFETAAHGMALVSLDGHWLKVNKSLCDIVGYSEQELLSTNFQTITHPDDLDGNLMQFKKMLDGELGSYQMEKRYIHKNGAVIWVLLSVSLIRNSTGQPLHLISQLIDITARKQAESELKKAKDQAENANQAKSEFLSSMSHELRTPLNAIVGFTELLELNGKLEGQQLTDLNEIKKASHHLLGLINDILDLAKIESRRVDLSMETLSLPEHVEQCCKLVEQQAVTKNIEIINNCRNSGDNAQFIVADAMRLKQVLINLLSNAVKYNRESGSIFINCQNAGDRRVRLNISDTGVGIATEKTSLLFEPFNRLGAENSHIEGTGIGLVITKRLVEKMGGKIGFYTTEGLGSTFWIEFAKIRKDQPDVPNTSTRSIPAIRNNALGESTHNLNTSRDCLPILVVEDNPTNQLLLGSQLNKLGHQYHIASSAAEALQLWKNNKYALVLTDINLPDTSGIDLAQQIRKYGKDSNANLTVPIIAVTANALKGDRETFLQSGMNDYVAKPIELLKLNEAINRWILPHSHNANLPLTIGDTLTAVKSPSPGNINPSVLKQYVGDEPEIQRTIVQSFLRHTPKIIKYIDTACENRDAAAIFFQSHKLKSSARTVGAEKLADIARQLEIKSQRPEWKEIFVLKNNLIKQFDALKFPKELLKTEKCLSAPNQYADQLKILIVDDDAFILEHSVCILKRAGLAQPETAHSGKAALETLDKFGKENVDLILCDFNMPHMDGVEFLEELSRIEYQGGVILISGVVDDSLTAAGENAKKLNLNILGVLEKPLTGMAVKNLLSQSS